MKDFNNPGNSASSSQTMTTDYKQLRKINPEAARKAVLDYLETNNHNISDAAASFGIMSGWSGMVVKDLFADSIVKNQFKIPEGYDVYAAAFFGYPLGEVKNRGPRKEGTVTIL